MSQILQYTEKWKPSTPIAGITHVAWPMNGNSGWLRVVNPANSGVQLGNWKLGDMNGAESLLLRTMVEPQMWIGKQPL